MLGALEMNKQQIDAQLSAEILAVAKLFKNGSTKKKLHIAKRIVFACLNAKASDVPQEVRGVLLKHAQDLTRTYKDTGSNSPRSSQPNANPEQIRDKSFVPSQYPDLATCTQAGVNSGLSLAAAQENCKIYFPVDNRGGTTVTRNAQGGKTTTWIPPKGEIKHTKSASEQIPSWAVLQSDVSIDELESYFKSEQLKSASANNEVAQTLAAIHDIDISNTPYAKKDKGTRSASANEAPNHWFPESIADMNRRKSEERQNQIEQQNENQSRIKSAKKTVETPAWAVLAGYD